MKYNLITVLPAALIMASCSTPANNVETATVAVEENASPAAGQSAVNDEVSQPNVVKVAVGSKDHTTLVKAVQAADLVNSLSNNGPFTVFAPTNAAFDALPEGTLDNLLKPENKDALSGILEHHVLVGRMELNQFADWQVLGMVDGNNTTITVKDGKYFIDGAAIVASVPASNGIVHVIDKVVLPAKK